MDFIEQNLSTIVVLIMAFGGMYAMFSAKFARLETLIEGLRRDVEKHNQVQDRTSALEGDVKVVKSDVENIYHKIDEIRGAA